MQKNLMPLWMGLYLVGIFLSQSLLSFCGIVGVVVGVKTLWPLSRDWQRPGAWALAWALVAMLNLVLTSAAGWEALKNIPLIFLPLAAFLPLVPEPESRYRKYAGFLFSLVLLLTVAAFARSLFQAVLQKRPATGLMSNQIYFAYSILPLFLFFGELALRPWSKPRTLRLMVCETSLLGALLLMSHTRMTWIVMALWLGFRVVPRLWQKSRRALFAVLLGCGLAGGALFLYQPDFQNKWGRFFDSQDPSRLSRMVIWKHNLGLFRSAPFLGLGYERNAQIPLDAEKRSLLIQAGLNPDFRIFAHNAFLQELVNDGLLGLALWLGYWLMLARGRPGTRRFLTFMAVAGLTENIFNNSRAAHAFYWVCILFLLVDRYSQEGKEIGSSAGTSRNA